MFTSAVLCMLFLFQPAAPVDPAAPGEWHGDRIELLALPEDATLTLNWFRQGCFHAFRFVIHVHRNDEWSGYAIIEHVGGFVGPDAPNPVRVHLTHQDLFRLSNFLNAVYGSRNVASTTRNTLTAEVTHDGKVISVGSVQNTGLWRTDIYEHPPVVDQLSLMELVQRAYPPQPTTRAAE